MGKGNPTIGKHAGEGGFARAASMSKEARREAARKAVEARWEKVGSGLPRSTHTGPLRIGDVTIECAVLDDGRRVLTQEDFHDAIGRSRKAKGGTGASLQVRRGSSGETEDAPSFLVAKNLQSFIPDELRKLATPIEFRTAKGNKAYGYRAELLPAVCKVFVDAKFEGKLTARQDHVANRCYVLLNGLATVGIIALVDEATGYQADRDRQELHRILAAYIAPELLPWTKRFPDAFYQEMFRLRGWEYKNIAGRRTQMAGKLTNQIVYERLPEGVLPELRRKNPVDPESGRRKHRFHQYLSEDIGNEHLQAHLTAVVPMMRAARDWSEFERLMERAFPKSGDQLRFDILDIKPEPEE